MLTARDHAQTVGLAHRSWPEEVRVLGGPSPSGRAAKGRAIARRARALVRVAKESGTDVALSHGSYAQILACRAVGIPAVTMMDYEHQPANHLSFRLARRVVVPDVFPEAALQRFGVSPANVVRYPGFKEELYLAGFLPDPAVLEELRLDRERPIAVFRPPPEGALYHRAGNERFDELLELASRRDGVQVVVLPREDDQKARYGRPGITMPAVAVDGRSLLAYADVVVGAGGTMSREAALLGAPAYTVFAGPLASVDAELIRLGLLRDMRKRGAELRIVKRNGAGARPASPQRREVALRRLLDALAAAAEDRGS